jgi:hypothetical protein
MHTLYTLQVAHTAGVTSTPDFFVRELNTKGGDCVLMLATDGACFSILV